REDRFLLVSREFNRRSVERKRKAHGVRDGHPRIRTVGSPMNAQTLNVSGVFSLFEHAIAHSLKYPKIRLQTSTGQNVVLSRAGDKSKYTGQIQITDGRPYGANTYFGRIDKDGIFHVSTADASVPGLLARLSDNPANVAS